MKYLLISYELACYQQWLWYSESLCLEIRSRWGITGTATSKSPRKLLAWDGIHKKNPLSLGSARGGKRTLGGGGEGHHLWLVVFEVRTVKKWTEIYGPPLPRASHQGHKSKQSTRSVYYSKDLELDQYEV